MKFNIILPLLCLAQLSLFGQEYTPIRVEAKPWVYNNPNTAWKMFDTRIIDNIIGYAPIKAKSVNSYGSTLERPSEATGFYRTEYIDGRWWVIDPEGYRNIQVVINSLRPGGSERNRERLLEKYGTEENWINATADSLHHYGFTGAGSWSVNELLIQTNQQKDYQLTYTPNLNFMSSYGKKRGGTYQLPGNTGYPNQTIFVFDPEFEAFCDEHAMQLEKYALDKNLFGVFSDNELPIGMKNLEGYLSLTNPQDPGRLAAEAWLAARKKPVSEITDADRADFAGYVAETYYSIVSRAIKKYAPHHMYLGSRLHGGAKNIIPVMKAAGRFCDILSFNYYGVWTPQQNLMQQWAMYADKPFMITEFYTKAMDSGLANTTGAGFTVHNQTDKGYAYQHFCLELLASKSCVGWHFFKYQDNDPTAKNVDPSNIDSNKGIVDNDYQYYPALMAVMEQLHTNRYKLIDFFDRKRDTSDEWELVWGDEFDYEGLPDPKKWSYDTRGNSYGWGNNELQWYKIESLKNTEVNNGTLKIRAHKEPTSGKNYSSGRIMSKYKGDWLYGKIEVSAKLPRGNGTWPAIWMLSTENHYGTWPKSGEIDIMEHVGFDPDTVFSTTHTAKYNHVKGTQKKGKIGCPTVTTAFHKYTLEWEKDEYKVYVDDQLIFTYLNDGEGPESWPYNRPFHLILNLAIGGNLGGKKGVDDSLFPHTYEIDYVRVYQKEEHLKANRITD
ncbi:glycoside hydrolase family 16 protein [Parapedobacter soli]|uniref:glycoside hydrolase family 16 protein n=1 Tax=Parapedobacter soli TaxID=416955 RepID=UPI0021C5E447|nr:glycoside hydrolase family 16 protein [Parapedobacter soli]